MPAKARVFLAEDHDIIRKMEKELLTDQGHTVVIEATSLKQALACVKLAKKKGVNVAVLDGCLTQRARQADGKVIAEALRKEIPNIKIVSCAFNIQDWGDVNLAKENAEKLGDVVTAL